MWVVRRRSALADIPPCSATARRRLRTRHWVIHGSHQNTRYAHHAPVRVQKSANITAWTAKMARAMGRLDFLVVASTRALKFL